MAGFLRAADGSGGALSIARQMIVSAIEHLDASGTPADIAAHLDLALCKMNRLYMEFDRMTPMTER